MEPLLGREVLGAICLPAAASADPRKTLLEVAAEATRLG
jgi:glycine/D-amino acid oxidase-like deaminating enzyme